MDSQIKESNDDCRVQLLEHVPYVALLWQKGPERVMHACDQLTTNISKSRMFALDGENEKSVTNPRLTALYK